MVTLLIFIYLFIYCFGCQNLGFVIQEDMRTYDMEHVTFKKRGSQFLSLVVPGLAERRPSLVYGDYIFAKFASEYEDDESLPYQVCFC